MPSQHVYHTLSLGETIYGKNMVYLEQIATKGLSTDFISIGLAELQSKIIGHSNVAEYIFLLLKFSSFTDGALQQEGASR